MNRRTPLEVLLALVTAIWDPSQVSSPWTGLILVYSD